MMVLTLHNLAEAYKLLPSEALTRSTTFDLYVLDMHTKWLKYQNEQSKDPNQPKAPPKLTQEQMLEMIKRTRERELNRTQ
jgi:hypothetical protein